MTTTRILKLAYDCKLIIPETVTHKELQALIGFLGTLRKAGSYGNWNYGPDFSYEGEYLTVQMESVNLFDTSEEAQRLSKESRAEYDERTAKEKAAG